MSDEPIDTLIPQFSQFIIDENFNASRFATINKEFSVDSIAREIHDFYDDWHFRNPDRAYPTVQFFEQVHEQEGEERLLKLMQRIYNTLGGADEEILEQYPYLEVFEREIGFDTISDRITLQPDRFIEVENVPGTFYPSLIKRNQPLLPVRSKYRDTSLVTETAGEPINRCSPWEIWSRD